LPASEFRRHFSAGGHGRIAPWIRSSLLSSESNTTAECSLPGRLSGSRSPVIILLLVRPRRAGPKEKADGRPGRCLSPAAGFLVPVGWGKLHFHTVRGGELVCSIQDQLPRSSQLGAQLPNCVTIIVPARLFPHHDYFTFNSMLFLLHHTLESIPYTRRFCQLLNPCIVYCPAKQIHRPSSSLEIGSGAACPKPIVHHLIHRRR
jgi:hypothetical protein